MMRVRSPAALRRLLALGVLLTAAHVADAGIVGNTGAVNPRAAPSGTLTQGSIESNTQLQIWFESTVANPGSLSFDHVGANSTVNNGTPANPQTVVPPNAESYYLHLDKVGTGAGQVNLSGSVTFSAQIIGIWHTTAGLNGSDGTFAPAGLTYSLGSTRGLEFASGDSYSISADGLTLTINNLRVNTSGVDGIRILVSPEPGTISSMGLGLAMLAFMVGRRRRRRRAAADAPVTADA